mmetsp:Transcript_12824/g.40531  ORF Transcript_12824/g.40531 Transcript_12824/m.40531 type:complete len:217 (+) Transcript_12824:343-993(+)
MRAMPLPAAPAAPRPAAGALSTSRPPASTRRRKLGEEERTEELYFQEMAGRRYLADLAREHALMSQLDDRWEAIARVADRIIETATILHDERGGGVWGVSPLGLRGIKWELSIVDDAGGRGLLAAEYPLVPGGKIVLTYVGASRGPAPTPEAAHPPDFPFLPRLIGYFQDGVFGAGAIRRGKGRVGGGERGGPLHRRAHGQSAPFLPQPRPRNARL